MAEFQDTRRGDVWYADDSMRPEHIDGSCVCWGARPVVIVSSDAVNRRSSVVTVIPLTTNLTRAGMDDKVLLPAGTATSKNSVAKVDQITTVDRSTLTSWMGHVKPEQMLQIDRAIKSLLEL
jgi:mRNA-degrading endonuclease toxin of MazEF toxin-antitoxin module